VQKRLPLLPRSDLVDRQDSARGRIGDELRSLHSKYCSQLVASLVGERRWLEHVAGLVVHAILDAPWYAATLELEARTAGGALIPRGGLLIVATLALDRKQQRPGAESIRASS
jgi:hypothetical protein